MRHVICIAMAVSLLCSCSRGEDSLSDILAGAVSDGTFLYGHQDDLSYGHSWNVDDPVNDPIDRSDVRMVCGDYPAMLGIDLGGIELANECNLDGVNFDFIRRAAQLHHQRGGVVTASWHLRNILTGEDAWDISSNKAVASVLDGGENHDEFMVWLSRVADFLESLGFPVIFRPWHEHTMTFFWWGKDCCTADEYNALWRMTYDYIALERGLKDILWAISPNACYDFDRWMERYPGDEYVDIIGLDYYDNADGMFVYGLDACLAIQNKFCAEHSKILALTETGAEGIPDPQWWTAQLLPIVSKYPIAYLLTWRNASDRPTHFYGPYPGAGCEQDFVEFYNSDKTLFLNDIR